MIGGPDNEQAQARRLFGACFCTKKIAFGHHQIFCFSGAAENEAVEDNFEDVMSAMAPHYQLFCAI